MRSRQSPFSSFQKKKEGGKGFGLGLEGKETMGNESFDHFLTVRGRLFGLLQHGRYRKRFLFLAFLLPKKGDDIFFLPFYTETIYGK